MDEDKPLGGTYGMELWSCGGALHFGIMDMRILDVGWFI